MAERWLKVQRVEPEWNESAEDVYVERGDTLLVVPPGGALVEGQGWVLLVQPGAEGLWSVEEPRAPRPPAPPGKVGNGMTPSHDRAVRKLRQLQVQGGDDWRPIVAQVIRDLTRTS
jgi:hypothetical protein